MFKLNEIYCFKSPNHRVMWLEANKATNDVLIANSIMDNLFSVTDVDKDGDVTEIRFPSGQVLHADELDYSYLLCEADFKYFRKGGLDDSERDLILADLQKQIDTKLDEVFLLHTEIKKNQGAIMSRVTANGSDAMFVKSWDGWDEMDTMSIILYAVELNREFYSAEDLAVLDKFQVLDVCIMHNEGKLEFYGFTAEALQEQEDRRALGEADFCAQGETYLVPFKIVRA